jgi:SnoaL-like protein
MEIYDAREIESIRRLKAQYVRFGDTQQWDKFLDLLTDDFEGTYETMPRMSKDQPQGGSVRGKDVVGAAFKALLTGATTVHQVYSSEITLTGPRTATGIWAMHETVILPQCVFKGWGHYHEEYVKIDGAWKVRKSKVTRLRTEEQWT